MRHIVTSMLLLVAAQAAAQPARASRLPRGDERMLARILAMSDSRILDTTLVDSALATGGLHLRSATARAIGQVAGRVRSARLRDLLTDPDTGVAAEAAFALGLMRDTAGAPVLARALRRPSVGESAAWALGEIGTPARDAIVGALSDSSIGLRVREALLLSASRLRPVPLFAIVPHLTQRDAGVARAAAYAVARPAVAGGVRAIAPLETSADFETRALVALVLRRSVTGDSLAQIALPILRRLASDRDARVRVAVARSLASHGPGERAAVLTLLRDRDANVRIATAQVLFTPADTLPSWWIPLWAADTGLTYRRSLLESAARRGIELPGLAEWLGGNDWIRRTAALSAAQVLQSRDRRVALAAPLLADPNAAVRTTAFGIHFADTVRVGRDSLIAVAMADTSVMVRESATRALGAGRTPARAAAQALDAYRRARDDKEADARRAALAVIANAWRVDSANFDEQLRTALAALPRPDDALERATGIRVTPLAAWGPATTEPRSLAWYDSIVRVVVRPSLAGRPLVAELRTERGAITLELLGADAPLTVANFVRLARSGYYSNTRFHRVVPNFVVQDGDPTGTGSGGPGYSIRDELNRRQYLRGTLGMALGGPDTGGSQYFICHSAQPHLDGHYTIFGQLRTGGVALDRIVQGDRISSVRIR